MGQPQFEAQEVFTCIEMDKSHPYIIVEGHEVDVYDDVLRSVLGLKREKYVGWLVVSGADKGLISDFSKESKAKNFYAIVDRDFDFDFAPSKNLSCLSRYSIENFLFDTDVIETTLCRVLKTARADVKISIEDMLIHYQEELNSLLMLIVVYQKKSSVKNVAWSDSKIINKDCWTVHSAEVKQLETDIENCLNEVEDKNVLLDGEFMELFPGKMLLKGIYCYIKNIIKPPGFTKIYNNELAFNSALFGNLEVSNDFIECLEGARQFLVRQLSVDNK